MSQIHTLKSLEQVLETFLERVVVYKQPRLQVLEGINRLDDLARTPDPGTDFTEQVGEWFAAHNRLLDQKQLRTADLNRIGGILAEIRSRLDLGGDSPPAAHKISSEIERWRSGAPTAVPPRITLARGPERSSPPPPVTDPGDSIARFGDFLTHAQALYADTAGNKKHLLSVLDDLLSAATLRQNKDALILSAFIIYYLKLGNYKVEPFVKRLKHAEELVKGGQSHAEA
ncbi:MAG TPA: hypothetical protein PKY95_02800 [candidate division Zixibacteria bacterium]|nr:hypothetical protein [candidate division Zixibacteria bacterium]